MIITVTLNPAIDKTVEIESLFHGGLNRIRKVEYDAGGKGINVSKTIHELGGESVAVGFLAGNTGKAIENVLREKGILTDFIQVFGETRTNTKVFEQDGTLTELNEPGPLIGEAQVQELLEKLDRYAKEETLFILAGSIPAGVDAGIYRTITELVHRKGARVLLDADGEAFARALEAVPDMLKPNHRELEAYAGADHPLSQKEIRNLAEGFLKRGVEKILVSMGKEGAMMFCDGYMAKSPAVDVKIHSTVGAGDAMVAALAYAWEKHLKEEEAMKLCMAVSAGAVMTVGTKAPGRAVIEELLRRVKTEKL